MDEELAPRTGQHNEPGVDREATSGDETIFGRRCGGREDV